MLRNCKWAGGMYRVNIYSLEVTIFNFETSLPITTQYDTPHHLYTQEISPTRPIINEGLCHNLSTIRDTRDTRDTRNIPSIASLPPPRIRIRILILILILILVHKCTL